MRWQGTDVDVLENPAVRTDDPLHYPDLTLPILDDDSVDTTGKSWPEPMKGERYGSNPVSTTIYCLIGFQFIHLL